MKPSTLIVMSVGLVITIVGFVLCLVAQKTADSKYPNNDLFSSAGENYEVVDGNTVRTVDFSDVIQVEKDNELKEVAQDVKVLSVKLKNIDHVEIVGHSLSSKVMVYNMQPGLYACQISAGVMTVTNEFEDALAFDYLSDAFKNFNGIRKYFRPGSISKKEKKVIITVNDDDLLNRIDLHLTGCSNVTVKNLTCSLDCRVVLNNSNITFDSCSFKEKEIYYPEPDPSVLDSNGDVITPEPVVTEHFFTMDIDMKNQSNFTANSCRFSSLNAIVNKKMITEKDVTAENSIYTAEQIGTYVSSGGKKCTLKVDLSTAGVLYGYNIKNVPDEEQRDDVSLVTVINGYAQSENFMENAGNKDFPQISIHASNCEIDITN